MLMLFFSSHLCNLITFMTGLVRVVKQTMMSLGGVVALELFYF